MANDSEDIILRLKPVTLEAFDVLRYKRNHLFLEHENGSPLPNSPTTPQVSSGEMTPHIIFPSGVVVLKYSQLPYDGQMGWRFGTFDRDECDVLLHHRSGGHGVSRFHFRIYFNWRSGCPILIDESRYGTKVISRLAGDEAVVKKTAIPLYHEDRVQAGHVAFELIIPAHAGRGVAWQEYHNRFSSAIPLSQRESSLVPGVETFLPPGRLSLLADTLGKGFTGSVFKAIDGTGEFYAVKRFKESHYRDIEANILTSLVHVYLSLGIRKSLLTKNSLILSKHIQRCG